MKCCPPPLPAGPPDLALTVPDCPPPAPMGAKIGLNRRAADTLIPGGRIARSSRGCPITGGDREMEVRRDVKIFGQPARHAPRGHLSDFCADVCRSVRGRGPPQ